MELEGKAGFYNAYFGGKYDRNVLTTDLGKKFEGAAIGFKLWPACAGTHVYIDATLGLVAEHDIRYQDVEEITVFVGDFGQNLCEPLPARQKPLTSMDAKFSIPFSVAVAVTRKEVVINDYSPEGIRDAAVLQIAQKVIPKYDARLSVKRGQEPGMVEIKTKDGKAYLKRVDVPYGHSERPLAWKGLVRKFRDCVAHSAKPVPAENVDKVIDLIANLEKVDDVGRIIQLLA